MNVNSNGSNHDRCTHGDSEISRSLDNVVENSSQGSVLAMQVGLFNLGRNRALQSGTTETRPEDVRNLEDHARAMAREVYRDKFDPANNPHDAMIDAEYRKILAGRKEAEDAEQHAAANLRDEELRLARTLRAGPRPGTHFWLAAAFVAVISLTVSPTAHDYFFFTVPDDILAWGFSTVSALFLGGMETIAILSGRRTIWNKLGVVAGIVLGLGLCIVRLSAVHEFGPAMFSVGLTVVEIAAVLFLDWLARGLVAHEDEWTSRAAAETEATACRDAARQHLADRQARVKQLNDLVREKILYVEDRHNRNIHIGELEAVAIKAVLDGYNAGVAENTGRVRGIQRRA